MVLSALLLHWHGRTYCPVLCSARSFFKTVPHELPAELNATNEMKQIFGLASTQPLGQWEVGEGIDDGHSVLRGQNVCGALKVRNVVLPVTAVIARYKEGLDWPAIAARRYRAARPWEGKHL